MLEGDIGECICCGIGIARDVKHYENMMKCREKNIFLCEDCYNSFVARKENKECKLRKLKQ